MRAYHFNNGKTLRDGRPLPPIGVWLEHDGPLVPCYSGLHACLHPFDGLRYAPGVILDLVEIDGEMMPYDYPPDKVVCTKRLRLQSIDAKPLLREFIRWCALQVCDLWDCPVIARTYLETGDENKRADAEASLSNTVSRPGCSTIQKVARIAALHACREFDESSLCMVAWSIAVEIAYAHYGDDRNIIQTSQRAKFKEMVDAAFSEATQKS
jgi:hypothetical protein